MRYRALLAGIVFAACGSAAVAAEADKFVGEWKRPKYPKETLTVSKDGPSRLSFLRRASNANGGTVTRSPLIGEMQGDKVVVNGLVFAVIQQNGSLNYSGWEYVRKP